MITVNGVPQFESYPAFSTSQDSLLYYNEQLQEYSAKRKCVGCFSFSTHEKVDPKLLSTKYFCSKLGFIFAGISPEKFSCIAFIEKNSGL